MSFSLYKAPLFILSRITMDGLRKILCFFNLILKLFFGDLVLIKNQLNFYEKIGLKGK
jgi:hypothetical protein